ncbi:MAG: altronate dehydratase, partial [Betaproteobacteria bacterium]|nr:altronate dehydratase [Betaproteobacteria bacterium]
MNQAVAVIRKAFLRLHPQDDVVIAIRPLSAHSKLDDSGQLIELAQAITPGHKIASRSIAAGEPVRRYNQIIGFARQAILAGEHVHSHNLAFDNFDR